MAFVAGSGEPWILVPRACWILPRVAFQLLGFYSLLIDAVNFVQRCREAVNSTGNGVHRPAGSNFEFGFWLLQDIWLQETRVYFNSHTSRTFSDYALGWEFTSLSFLKLPIPLRDTHSTPLLGLEFPLFGSSHTVPQSLLWMGFLVRGPQVMMNEPFCHHDVGSDIITSLPALSPPCYLPQPGRITNPRFPPLPQSLFSLTASSSSFSTCEHA